MKRKVLASIAIAGSLIAGQCAVGVMESLMWRHQQRSQTSNVVFVLRAELEAAASTAADRRTTTTEQSSQLETSQ
jgi:hypothetical protein